MFTYVKLNNYRSLNNVEFDLRDTKDKVKQLVAVYGENGCGKSTLIRSFYFLELLMHSFDVESKEIEMKKLIKDDQPSEIISFFRDLLNDNSLSSIYTNSRAIGTSDNTIVEIGFKKDDHEGYYLIEFGETIVHEKLYYFTGNQSGVVYEISKDEIKEPKLSPAVFKTSKIRNEYKELIQKFWGKHSLLAISYNMLKELNKEYVLENVSKYLYDLHSLIGETSVLIKEKESEKIVLSGKHINCLSDLEKGDVSDNKEWLLRNTEAILNDFFTQTYSDVKKVCFETEGKDNRIMYHLVFYKMINGDVKRIPVEKESTGTRQILYILRNLFGAFCGCTVIIDEIDNGVHDLLLKVIIDSMKQYITGQLIFTTHNTSLLESLNPKMVYIINGKYDGTKEIICLSEFDLQDHNSPRIRYMKGLFGGIPFVESVDYNKIIGYLKKNEG